MAATDMLPYSVLVLTKNEEVNIADCLRSVPPGVPVCVLDSFSSDLTVSVAKGLGARVHQRRFDNYAAQRNHGLHAIEWRTPWVLMLDADERMSPELHAAIVEQIDQATADITLFRMRRKDMFMGRWLRRSSGYPTWFGRLVRPESVRVEREINEEFVTDGAVGYLDAHLIHHPFNKGLDYWIERHNRYSTMEAVTLNEEAEGAIAWRQLFSRDPARRRKCVKQIAYRLPMRPLLVFVYLFIVRGGFLDGRAGLVYCKLRLVYELMIDAKRAQAVACRKESASAPRGNRQPPQ